MLSLQAYDRPAGSPWPRRAVLRAGLRTGLGVGLALLSTGCTLSDPAIRGGTVPVPGPARTPSTVPAPGPPASATATAAVAEQRLADLAEQVRTGSSTPTAAQRALLRVVRATHLERATALASPQPADRPSGPPPATTPAGLVTPATLAGLAAAERATAERYRRAAASAGGLTALLWGSMAVASERFARALGAVDTPGASAPRTHRPMALVADTAAVSALVAGLHATVYGYQLALGRLSPGSTSHDRATAGLRDRRLLLAELSERLDAAGADVPAAKPAYVPDPQPRDAASAGRLIRHLESALLPFCGLWLAAAGRAADRRRALAVLADTASRAERWGGSLQPWPGWSD